MSCDCVDKKCHVFPTQSRNYLPYPTVRSIIEYFSYPAFFKGFPFFFPFVVDILPGGCLDLFIKKNSKNIEAMIFHFTEAIQNDF